MKKEDGDFLWSRLKTKFLNPSQPDKVFQSWLKELCLLPPKENLKEVLLTLQIPSLLHKKWASEHILPFLKEKATDYYKKPCQIDFKIQPAVLNRSVSLPRGHGKPVFFNPDYLFENFIVGNHNEFAHGVCVSLAKKKENDFNPLFICGPSGVGKTHLLNALGQEFLKNHPWKKIHYLSAERFLNECIHSLQKREMKQFQKKYRNQCDMLLLDDIQMIARGTVVQEEFFHTFNELFNKKIPVVVCCDSLPSRIPGLEERLRTRMEGGVVVEMSYPELETRIAILKSKLERKQLILPEKIIFHIAQNCKQSIREMEGTLNKIKMLSDLKGGVLSPNYINTLLTRMGSPPLTVLEIQKKVAKKFHVSIEDMLSPSRKKTTVLARQTAMYFIKKSLQKSLSDIGRLFGGKDHSTVMNSLKKVEKLKVKDPDFKQDWEELQREIQS